MEKNWYFIYIDSYGFHNYVEFLSRAEINEKYLKADSLEVQADYIELLLPTGEKKKLTFFNRRLHEKSLKAYEYAISSAFRGDGNRE